MEIEPERPAFSRPPADADLAAEAMRHEAEAKVLAKYRAAGEEQGWWRDEELHLQEPARRGARGGVAAKAARDLAELNVRNAYVQAASRGRSSGAPSSRDST
ncbi:MAG: hypothetical protein U0166_13640 [Acidobacteriota bacterium]